MKKTTKTMSTLALSAVLALGCAMPAFADDADFGAKVGEDASQLNNTSDGTAAGTVTNGQGDAYTDINLRTITDQINCTLPLEMTVAAKTLGGPIICPSSGAYSIQNNVETGSLYIIGMKADLQEGWAASSKTSLPSTTEKLNNLDAKYGTVYMQVTADGDTKQLTKNEATTVSYDKMAWAVPAKSDSAAGTLALDLAGHASPITGVATDEAAGVQLMKVTYTVSAMHPDNATKLASEVSASTTD